MTSITKITVTCFLFFLLFSLPVFSQDIYEDSIRTFQKNYVNTHEVVKGADKKAMAFYPVDKTYKVKASFEKSAESKWIHFPTSGKLTKVFKEFGALSFTLHGQPHKLIAYQSQDLMASPELASYLFLPFTDLTTGKETYDGGRYMDLSITDRQDGFLELDFNKAYNPYCAYVSGIYNCPIPPKENALSIAIKAGEKNFSRQH